MDVDSLTEKSGELLEAGQLEQLETLLDNEIAEHDTPDRDSVGIYYYEQVGAYEKALSLALRVSQYRAWEALSSEIRYSRLLAMAGHAEQALENLKAIRDSGRVRPHYESGMARAFLAAAICVASQAMASDSIRREALQLALEEIKAGAATAPRMRREVIDGLRDLQDDPAVTRLTTELTALIPV